MVLIKASLKVSGSQNKLIITNINRKNLENPEKGAFDQFERTLTVTTARIENNEELCKAQKLLQGANQALTFKVKKETSCGQICP